MPPIFSLRYTLCFLQRGEDVLMLHRKNPPNQGLWNGVGGHIEPGETPLASVLREVWEETGCRLAAARFAGLLTWSGFETPPGGLYIYTAPVSDADLPSGHRSSRLLRDPDLRLTDEGELAWQPRAWVCTSPQVVSNIHVFGPPVLAGAPPLWYHFDYKDGAILRHNVRPLPATSRLTGL